jgi:hypothetical protein
MISQGILIVVALAYSTAVAVIGRRLPRPASVAAYWTALATLIMVLLLSESTRQRVDGLLLGMGTGRLLFYLALMTQLCGLFLTLTLATNQWAPRHWLALGGAGVLTVWYVGLWLRVKTLNLSTMAGVFYGRRVGSPPAVLWMHIVTGLDVIYIAAWGLMACLRFLREARSTYEHVVAGVVVVLYALMGLSGICTIVEAVGHHLGVDIAVVYQAKPFLRIVLAAGATCVLIGHIWLWPLWRHRRQLLLRYVEPELVQLRHDLLNLSAVEAELHLDIHHEAYANRAMVEDVAARCRAAGISPARCAMARMATSLITFHRDNLLQDPSYGLVTSWDALMEDAAAEIDQAMALTAWERALRDGYIAQQVYILMFLVLDCRAYREILLIDERPQVQAWHQQLADIIATVMQAHGHATPRDVTLAQHAAPGNGFSRLRTRLTGRRNEAASGLGKPSPSRVAPRQPGSWRDQSGFSQGHRRHGRRQQDRHRPGCS